MSCVSEKRCLWQRGWRKESNRHERVPPTPAMGRKRTRRDALQRRPLRSREVWSSMNMLHCEDKLLYHAAANSRLVQYFVNFFPPWSCSALEYKLLFVLLGQASYLQTSFPASHTPSTSIATSLIIWLHNCDYTLSSTLLICNTLANTQWNAIILSFTRAIAFLTVP